MKNKILSIIGMVWGSAIILKWFLTGPSGANSAAKAGEFGALIMGFVLLGLSIYNYRRKPKEER